MLSLFFYKTIIPAIEAVAPKVLVDDGATEVSVVTAPSRSNGADAKMINAKADTLFITKKGENTLEMKL